MYANISMVAIFIIAFVLPMIIVPLILPKVALMARRKRFTDNPNSRKLQSSPVMVTGGIVLLTAITVTLTVVSVFYSMDVLFSALCVIVVFFLLGLLDDAIGLSYQYKLLGQILLVLLLYLCGGYRIDFHITTDSFLVPLGISLFVGLLLINAFNFIDGIDGLASALGIMMGSELCWWNTIHGYYEYAIYMLILEAALLPFFFFNVFSSKYKMYLGDSGSLMLGASAYIGICLSMNNSLYTEGGLESYDVSFFLAVFAVVIFDLLRVVFFRILHGKSPFLPDRTHLHHMMVDLGCNHFMSTMTILTFNIIVLMVWLVTAYFSVEERLQTIIILVTALALVWGPYAFLRLMQKRCPERYARLQEHTKKVSLRSNYQISKFQVFIDSIGQRRRSNKE